MKTAGVVVDDYKLPTFRRVLDAAGYSYTEHKGLTDGTTLMRVEYDWVAALKPVIEQAERESKK